MLSNSKNDQVKLNLFKLELVGGIKSKMYVIDTDIPSVLSHTKSDKSIVGSITGIENVYNNVDLIYESLSEPGLVAYGIGYVVDDISNYVLVIAKDIQNAYDIITSHYQDGCIIEYIKEEYKIDKVLIKL